MNLASGAAQSAERRDLTESTAARLLRLLSQANPSDAAPTLADPAIPPSPSDELFAGARLHLRRRLVARAGAATPANSPPPNPSPPSRTRLQPPRPPAEHPARARRLVEYADFRVDDAGLVLLWPFLGRLFERTGLREDGRFADGGVMQAVALLKYLATGEPGLAEYHLPLAKLLLGLRAEDEYQPGPPPTPEQLGECDCLLATVLEHAPAINIENRGIDGLRANYLRRPGLLGVRDGAWLLRVEHRPHDVLLERLPWAWAWIKGDWMFVPLQVEW